MKLVIYPPVELDRLAKLQEAAGEMLVVNAADEQAAMQAIVDADAFYGRLTARLLAPAKRLRWVQSPTASLEHYVFPELVEHSCTLTNMRGLYSDVIADHVFGFILCFCRNLHIYIRQQMAARWEPVGGEEARGTMVLGPGVVTGLDRSHIHVSDCTLGIVGLGGIGSEIARRGLAFGMRVLAVDPVQTSAPPGVESLWSVDRLEDLLSQSDFVAIAAPHTPQTAGMFRRPQFQRMKKSAYLINVGRGVIVNLKDLCDALQAGEIAGAGLDVFEQEPLPPDHPLWSLPNVILTPHIASSSVHLASRHLHVLRTNIDRFVRGQPLLNVVRKESWF